MVSQIEQLILDLAVQRQFDQTKKEMESMAMDAKSLQEELQAVQFSQDSKAGRMLMAKCRALQVGSDTFSQVTCYAPHGAQPAAEGIYEGRLQGIWPADASAKSSADTCIRALIGC